MDLKPVMYFDKYDNLTPEPEIMTQIFEAAKKILAPELTPSPAPVFPETNPRWSYHYADGC